MLFSQVLQMAYVATPLICWTVNATLLRRRVHWALLFVLACLAGYLVLMTAVQAVETELDRELYRHDRDGDGMFSEDEMTPEAERAMDAVTSDTGRTFAPITGIPITFVWTAINFAVLAVVDWTGRFIWRSIRGADRGPDSADAPKRGTRKELAVNPENPYQPPGESQ